MLRNSLIIARKEMLDGLRDIRSLISSAVYSLMGPGVVFLVSLTKAGSHHEVLAGMMSVFTLVSAFVGGMNVAMDTIAGERERRSLLPLLLNPIPRLDVVLGKWLAVSFFSTAALMINLAGFAAIFVFPGNRVINALSLIPLAMLAAALELLISTTCRSVKEAHTYLSLVVFLPMGAGMFLVFYPGAVPGWWHFLPVVGQHLQLQQWMSGRELHVLQPLIPWLMTAAFTVLALLAAAHRLQRDDIVYGN